MRKDNKGSFTVEASLAVPIFVLAITIFLLIFKLLFIQVILQDALTEAGKEVSQMAYIETSLNNKSLSEEVTRMTSGIVLEREIQKFFQQSKSQGSLLSGSINYQESRYNKEQGNIELVATYKIKMPFSVFQLGEICFTQRVKTNAFIGKGSLLGTSERENGEDAKDEYVYITETGTVYHKTLECSSLKLQITRCRIEDLKLKRNESGGIYKSCEKCCKNMNGISEVYICKDGEKYHKSIECSGLKRTIQRVPLKDVEVKMRVCYRCGSKEK